MSKPLSLLVTLLCAPFVFGQINIDFCEQLDALKEIIVSEHISPKPLGDDLSKGVYSLFIQSLDPDKIFFTKSDLQEFSIDEYNLDQYIISNDCSFIDKYITKLAYRINSTKKILETLFLEKLDYSGKDTIHFMPKNELYYYKTEKGIKNYWNKNIQFSLLLKIIEEDTIFQNIKNDFTRLEKEFRPKIIQNQLCLLDELINQSGGIEKYTKELFLSAYSNFQDPNTIFFNYSEKELFEQSLSGDRESFGISTFKNDNGEIVIANVTVGSSAYKNGKIEKSDIVKSLTTGKSKLEAYCVSNMDVEAFLNDSNHKTVIFKIKKKDGEIKDVKLHKTITKVEENLTRAYIVSNTSKVGYINIPSFYTDFESPNGLGVANDVAKELIRLDKENVSGLIIDLRFNGGGSLKEASDLCGLFINRGPLAIFKYNTGETYTTRDLNRGVIFNKPIVIIVNHYSASASEFFASAMQDYNRAIIVGTTTYGKSSGQIILPLNETKDLGFCKVTTDKFYRVTGASNQSIGVLPDIKFPSTYDGLEINEAYQKYALTADSVQVNLKAEKLKSIPLKSIKENSLKRMRLNESFSLIEDINQLILNDFLNGKKDIILTLENVYTYINNYNALWNDFINHFDTIETSLTSSNTKYTNEYLEFNEAEKKTNSILLKEISKDIYIEESYNIIIDYLKIISPN